MRAANFVEGEENKKYPATQYSAGERTAIGRIFKAGGDLGYKEKQLTQLFSEAGYEISRSVLYDYKSRINQGGTPLSANKKSGPPRSLTPEQERWLVGWAVKKFADSERCTLADGTEFIRVKLGASVHDKTTRNYFLRNGLKSKKVVFKSKAAALTMDEIVEMYIQWIKEQRLHKNITYNRLFASLDFTYLSHRNTSYSSFSPVGFGSPTIESIAPQHTNCAVTLLWSDGINRTPPLLYSYNKGPSTNQSSQSGRRSAGRG